MLEINYVNTVKSIQYGHTRGKAPVIDFHLHDGYEIYFLLSGDVNYFIEKKVYPIKYGDLFITNNHEIHKPSFQSQAPYERIILQFDPSMVKPFNSPTFDLLHCFVNRPKGEQNKLSLNKNQLEDIMRIFDKFEELDTSSSNGSDILKLIYLVELLVFLNRIFVSTQHVEEHPNVPDKLIPVLDYIDENLEADLSLELLEQRFFINRFHLSRLFKKSTGSNIHQYVIFKRVSKAKKLLSEGFSVTETCALSGFSDYSNFIRTFKKTTGISPGQYKKRYA